MNERESKLHKSEVTRSYEKKSVSGKGLREIENSRGRAKTDSVQEMPF